MPKPSSTSKTTLWKAPTSSTIPQSRALLKKCGKKFAPSEKKPKTPGVWPLTTRENRVWNLLSNSNHPPQKKGQDRFDLVPFVVLNGRSRFHLRLFTDGICSYHLDVANFIHHPSYTPDQTPFLSPAESTISGRAAPPSYL